MAAAPRIGDVIAGKYCVERVLGRGGMGVVVAARHLHLRERVAIKFLVEGRGRGGDVVARFVREGRAAMRIRSEHVVRVHDIGTLDTGEPFLVMEYLEGSDLAAIVARDGPLPIEAAVEYVLQAIEALAEAHARGIVHRDLKPQNLFLAHRADGSPVVKVLDFGIAKSTGADAEPSATDSNALIGTPAYMAPEQMRSRGAVDARTDVWALGVTLHALLTGAPPFPAGSVIEIHESLLRGARPLREARPGAPAALEAVLLRCMATAPGDRYASVAEVAEALAAFAPEEARVSARRAAKILSAAPLVEDVEGTPGTVGDAADAADAGATRAGAEASWNDAMPGGATTGSRTGASPHVVTSAPLRGRPAWQRVLALAVAAAAGGVVVLAALGARRTAPAEPRAAPAPSASIVDAGSPGAAPASSSAPAAPGAGHWKDPAPRVSSSAAPPRPQHRPPPEAPGSASPKPAVRPRDPLADPD